METIPGHGRPGEVIRNFTSLALAHFSEAKALVVKHDNYRRCVLHNFARIFLAEAIRRTR
jgi:hypothetical protein